METIVFKIGAAVAKAILKLWLKDSAIARAVGLGLADVLEKKVSDIRAQRRAKRPFEAIGDRIAESLLPLFEHSNLEENDKEAVGLAVAGTLEDAQITPALLARQNLDPVELDKHFWQTRPDATRDFSEAATEFYQYSAWLFGLLLGRLETVQKPIDVAKAYD